MTVAAVCLALAAAWRAALVFSDYRRIRGAGTGQRMYRPGQGWTDAHGLDARRRWAWAGAAAVAGLVPVMFFRDSVVAGTVAMLSCGVIVGWVLRDGRLHRARYTSVCIATLAGALFLFHGTRSYTQLSAAVVAGTFASFFAAQLYLAAGIRKLRSTQFMSGRVIVDNLAYGAYQAAAGNREFLRLVSMRRLADLLSNRAFLAAGRLAAVLTAAVELALGVGAIGLLPGVVTLGLAVPSHLAFVLVSPRRIVPFTVAALGLLVMATTHPLLAVP